MSNLVFPWVLLSEYNPGRALSLMTERSSVEEGQRGLLCFDVKNDKRGMLGILLVLMTVRSVKYRAIDDDPRGLLYV